MFFLDWLKKIFWDDLLLGMDSSQFFFSLIATFIGVFLPFFIQRRRDASSRIEEAICSLKNIETELLSIKDEIGRIRSNGFKEVHLSPIQTPIWDGLLNSNGTMLLSELRKYIQDFIKKNKKADSIKWGQKDWYERVFRVYNSVGEYNRWWTLYTESIYNGRSKQEVEKLELGINKLNDELIGDITAGDDSQYDKMPYNNINCLIAIIKKILTHVAPEKKATREK